MILKYSVDMSGDKYSAEIHSEDRRRCAWADANELLRDYHDNEYGVPVHDDNIIFERLMLEIYQAGLTWNLILQRRAAFRLAFHDFDIDRVAAMTDAELDALMENPGIIRNRIKIQATRHNARTCRELITRHGSLKSYLSGLPYRYSSRDELRPCVVQMKKDGLKFLGPLILEEFFMSIGMNDVLHSENCFLHGISSADR